ncbi:MAG: PAS domain S-box protein [Deltaproteobacteria bacterium]|nr:PAS domain S-box protein [Deltaproteobacteria bacterium]
MQDKALQENQERYRSFFEKAAVAAAIVDLNGKVIEANEADGRFLGYSPAELIGMHYTQFTHPRDIALDGSLYRSLVEGRRQSYEIEKRYIRRDGKVVWGRLAVSMIRDSKGRPAYTLVVCVDITEHKRAEAALQLSEERFALAMEANRDGIWDWQVDTGEVYYSPAYTAMLGYEALPPHVNSWTDLIHPEDKETALKANMDCINNLCDTFEIEFRMKAGNGEWRWILGRGKAVKRDQEGQALRMIGTHTDITDRKRAEAELKESQEKLRALSARLQSVREEERGKIAREIHDDLGQQLTGLKMDLGWLLRHLNPDQLELVKKARAMSRLIDRTVKTVRRISTELRPRILDDFGLIAALEWQAQEFSEKTGIVCRFRSTLRKLELEPDLSAAIFRIFQEALTNVARHSQATRVTATFKEEHGGLVLTISDNGRGISEEEIVRSGSLGLIGMRERALPFGGTVVIKGKKGKGTSITLYLPTLLT